MVTNGSAEKYWARLEDKVKIFGVELRQRQVNSETKTFEPEVALIGQNQTKTLVLPQSWMEAWIDRNDTKSEIHVGTAVRDMAQKLRSA
jgi:hypothetical protein